MSNFPSRFGVNQAYADVYASPFASLANAYALSNPGYPTAYAPSYGTYPSFGTSFPSIYSAPGQSIANAYATAQQNGSTTPIQSNLWGQAASGSFAHGVANGVDTQALTLSSQDYQLALAIARSQDTLAWSLAANTPYGTTSNAFALTPQGFFVNGQPYQGQNLGYDPFALLQGHI